MGNNLIKTIDRYTYPMKTIGQGDDRIRIYRLLLPSNTTIGNILRYVDRNCPIDITRYIIGVTSSDDLFETTFDTETPFDIAERWNSNLLADMSKDLCCNPDFITARKSYAVNKATGIFSEENELLRLVVLVEPEESTFSKIFMPSSIGCCSTTIIGTEYCRNKTVVVHNVKVLGGTRTVDQFITQLQHDKIHQGSIVFTNKAPGNLGRPASKFANKLVGYLRNPIESDSFRTSYEYGCIKSDISSEILNSTIDEVWLVRVRLTKAQIYATYEWHYVVLLKQDQPLFKLTKLDKCSPLGSILEFEHECTVKEFVNYISSKPQFHGRIYFADDIRYLNPSIDYDDRQYVYLIPLYAVVTGITKDERHVDFLDKFGDKRILLATSRATLNRWGGPKHEYCIFMEQDSDCKLELISENPIYSVYKLQGDHLQTVSDFVNHLPKISDKPAYGWIDIVDTINELDFAVLIGRNPGKRICYTLANRKPNLNRNISELFEFLENYGDRRITQCTIFVTKDSPFDNVPMINYRLLLEDEKTFYLDEPSTQGEWVTLSDTQTYYYNYPVIFEREYTVKEFIDDIQERVKHDREMQTIYISDKSEYSYIHKSDILSKILASSINSARYATFYRCRPFNPANSMLALYGDQIIKEVRAVDVVVGANVIRRCWVLVLEVDPYDLGDKISNSFTEDQRNRLWITIKTALDHKNQQVITGAVQDDRYEQITEALKRSLRNSTWGCSSFLNGQ